MHPGESAGQEILGPDGGTMLWVPPGEFDMGQESVETPVHRVRISRGFWLGQGVVTNAQYRRYCQAVGAAFPPRSDQGDNHPVVDVSWAQAEAYCRHYALALPTEAQWEYAGRGADSREYPWGDRWEEGLCCSSTLGTGPAGRCPVGSFPAGASWCRALDMTGNVWQWCRDWFAPDYYSHSPETDPPGPRRGECRLARGGWWRSTPQDCRVARRYAFDPLARYDTLGFRCLLVP
jgi:iron(II)-dependent oxidoreductase